MIKILAIGHSIVKGAGDGNEISAEDPRPRPPSPCAPHIPEGGWNHENFQIKPRWGDRAPGNAGGPGWVVRVGDELPPGTVQVFNEGYSGGAAYDWDPQGRDFLGKIFARIDEPLPPDIDLAVVAIMANDFRTPANAWRDSVGRIVDFLKARAIQVVLAYDWFHGVGTGEYYTGDATASYDAMCRCVDDLVRIKGLPPPLDIRSLSEENYKRGGATFCADMDAWHTHPNTAGMVAAAREFARYLRIHVLNGNDALRTRHV